MAGRDSLHLSPRAFAGLFVCLFAIAAVPVLICGILPLVDYPNHLARMTLLARLPQDGLLQHYYALAWRPIPDLAMDALVPPLLRLMPLASAGRAFVLLMFLLIAGGASLLGRVLNGRWSPWPLLVFLLLYNRLLLWGLLNYLFGLGLALLAFALMLVLDRRSVALRLAAGTAAAFAIYFAHLMAFGVYAAALASSVASRPARDRFARTAIILAPLVLPLLLLALSGDEQAGTLAFSAPWRKLDLPFSVFDLYHRPFDVACFLAWAGALAWGYWRGWLTLAPAVRWPLAALTLLYLLMPTQMLGATGIDRRLPLAIALFLTAGTSWATPEVRRERIALGAAAALFVLRMATVIASWHASDRIYRSDLAALESLPMGARLAVAAPPDAAAVVATPLLHLPALAAAERDAFVPTLFTYRGQQPIAIAPAYADLAAASAPARFWQRFVAGAPDAGEDALLRRYGFVAFVGLRPFALARTEGLEPLYLSPRFQLYRVGG
jgi:hypothetical protein